MVIEITTKWEELKVYLPPTDDPDEIQKRADQDLIFTYLRSQILLITEMPSFDEVVATIDREESRRLLMNPQEPQNSENKAFKAQSQPFPNPRTEMQGDSALRCDHYKRDGHRRKGCWFFYPHLRLNRKGNEGFNKGGEKRQWEGHDEKKEKRGFVASPTQSESSLSQGNGSNPTDSTSSNPEPMRQLLESLSVLLKNINKNSGMATHLTYNLN